MTRHPISTDRSDEESSRSKASAEWLPAGDERLRVTTTVTSPSGDMERVLRLQPDRLVRLAYGTNPSATDETVVSLTPIAMLPWLGIPAAIEFSTPQSRDSGAVISLRWRAKHFERFFPVLRAEVEIHTREGATELVLDGRYRPPLGLIGLIFDHLVGKRLARAVAVGFVEALANAVKSERPTARTP